MKKRSKQAVRDISLVLLSMAISAVLIWATIQECPTPQTIYNLSFLQHTPDGAMFTWEEDTAITTLKMYINFTGHDKTGDTYTINGFVCQECGTQDDCLDNSMSALLAKYNMSDVITDDLQIKNITWYIITRADINYTTNETYFKVFSEKCMSG